MGENTILNKEQVLVFDELSKSDFIKSVFYFSGGTALSEVYLKHRESIDLDFFSDSKYNSQEVLTVITSVASNLEVDVETQSHGNTQTYLLAFGNRQIKLDFSFYPYKRLQEGKTYRGFKTDSKLDIAVNKTLLIGSQRTEVKDFVDLYFLLKEFSIWDLIEGVKIKFRMKLEPYILSTDFTAAKDFEFLPKMHKDLSLEELKSFFIKEAKELGLKSTV